MSQAVPRSLSASAAELSYSILLDCCREWHRRSRSFSLGGQSSAVGNRRFAHAHTARAVIVLRIIITLMFIQPFLDNSVKSPKRDGKLNVDASKGTWYITRLLLFP